MQSQKKLRELRGERAVVAAAIAERIARSDHPRQVPTREEFEALLSDMDRVLLDAVESVDPADPGALRGLLELLTGGRIVVEQAGERRHFTSETPPGWSRRRFFVSWED